MVKRLSKRKIASFFLALVMIFSAMSFNIGFSSEAVNGNSVGNYSSVIGNTATFDLETYVNALAYSEHPETFVYEGDGNDWDNDDNWIYFSDDNITENDVLVITDYYLDSVTTALWYKVEAAPGYTLPEKLSQMPWVFQNFVDPEEAGTDTLIVSEGATNFIFDENGNSITSVELPMYEKVTVTAASTLQGDVKYQWQIRNSDGSWISIYGEDGEAIKLSFGMLANMLDENNTAYLRCKSVSGTKEALCAVIPVTVEPYNDSEEVTVVTDIVTSSGNTVSVSVSGNMPSDSSVNMEESTSDISTDDGEELLIVLDISVTNSDGTEWQPEDGEYVEITVPAESVGLSDGDKFIVYHEHNGEVEKIGPYTVADGELSFTVDGFSAFGIALVNTVAAATDYAGNVGKYGVLNLDGGWTSVSLHNDPTQITDYDGVWWNASAYLYEDFNEDMTFVVTDSYVSDIYPYAVWYKVDAAPGYTLPDVIAENPWVLQNWNAEAYADADMLVLSDAAAACNVTADGAWATEVAVSTSEKVTLTATSTLNSDSVSYQWQVYFADIDTWVDVSGQNTNTFTLNYGAADADGMANYRCVSSAGSQTAISETVTAYITTASVASYSLARSASSGVMAVDSEDDTTVTAPVKVTVKYVNGSSGERIADDSEFEVQSGTVFTQEIVLPVVEGYSAYLGDDTETIYTTYTINQAFTENATITFKYWPAKVNYTVIYYQQNAENDNYTEYERYTTTGFTGSYTTVENREYDGFYQLLYESVPIASDGSTVVEVYYDRLYYKMTFDLDGGYGVQPVYARYGTEIEIPTPTKAGYAFVGWDDVTSGTGDGIADELPASIPAYHSAYKAIWEEADSSYTVIYWKQNANPDDDGTYGYTYWTSKTIGAMTGSIVSGTDDVKAVLDGDGDSETQYTDEDEVYIYFSHADSNITVENDGTTTVNVYYDRNTYTLKFYYAMSSGNTYYVIGGSTYRFGATATITDTGNEISLLDHYMDSYSSERGQVDELPTLNAEGISRNYTLGTDTSTVGRRIYTYYYIAFEAKYGADISELWPCAVFNSVTRVGKDNTNGWSGTEAFVSAWNGEHHVYYSQHNENQTIKGNYEKLDYKLLFDTGDIDCYHNYADSSTVAYLCFWENGANIIWSVPELYRYNVYVPVLAGQDTTGLTTLTHNGVTYYLLDSYDTCDDSSVSSQTPPSLTGYKYKEYTSSEIIDFDTTLYKEAYDVNFFYSRESNILSFNDGTTVTKTESVLYGSPLSAYASYVPDTPSSYEAGSVSFEGWYDNPLCTGTAVDLNTASMPATNVILYAKWVPVVHTVRFYNDKSLVGTDELHCEPHEVPHGDTVQKHYTPPNDPERGQYIFEGWFYIDDNGNEQMWDFANTTVTRDTDIYAKWSSNTLVEYTVKFVYKDADGNEVEIADPITGSALGGNSKTFDAKGNEQLYEGYQEGYFPTVQSHTIVMDLDNAANNTYTFYYTKVDAVPYTVYYVTDTQNDEGTLKSTTLNGKTYYIVAETKEVPDNKKAIVTETYEKVPGYLPDTYQQTLILDLAKENIIIFEYAKDDVNGMYIVHYMTEDLDGGYSEHSVFEGRGTKDTVVNADIKAIENFTHNPLIDGTLLSGTISVDNVLELYVYYTRNTYPYKVQYLELGTNKVLSEEKLVEDVKWETIVKENAIDITNYTLVGDAEVSIQIRKDTEDPTVNIITFYYTENTATLNYVVAGGVGGTVSRASETLKISTGTAQGSTATAANGYRFVGWYSDPDCKVLLTANETYVPSKNADALWVDGTTYYAKFEPSTTSLTITKSGVEADDSDMAFVFTVVGTDDNTKDIELTVTIYGNDSVTITDLPVGNYTVTEKSDWSWRYDPDAENKTVELTVGGSNSVTFKNTKNKSTWLDDDSHAINIFDGDQNN